MRQGALVHVNDVSGVGSALVEMLRQEGRRAELVEPRKRLAHGIGRRAGLASNRAVFAADRAAVGLRLRRRRAEIDLVHVHYGMFGPIGMLSGLPFVLHFHGGDLIEDDQSACWHRIHVAAAGKARRCLVSTPDLLSYERRLAVRLEFLPNPVCVDVERGAGGGGVMFASKLDSRKGAEVFLPAAIRLARSGCPVTVLGFGSVARSYRDELEQLRGLGGRVVSRRIPQTAFNSLLADADVVVGQFAVGALGMSELDAMARGRAVVTKFEFPDAYRTPPALLRANSTDAIVVAVEGLLRATDRRDALGFEARKWVLEEHHPNTVGDRLLGVYRDALAA